MLRLLLIKIVLFTIPIPWIWSSLDLLQGDLVDVHPQKALDSLFHSCLHWACLRSSLCLGSRVTWFWWHFYFNHPTILRGSSHITISCQVIHLLIYTFLWSRLCHRFLCLRSFPSWGQSTVELSGTSWGFWYWYLVFGIWYMVFGMNYGSWTLKLSWGQLRSSLYQLG